MKSAKLRRVFAVICTVMLVITLPITTDMGLEVKAAVKINKTNEKMIVGQRLKLKVYGTGKKVVWSSSKKKVAKVSSKGTVKALKNGNTVITAKIGNKKYRCRIKVEKPELNVNSLWLAAGDTYKLKINGTSQKTTWKSKNMNVVTVSDGRIKAVAEGKTTVIARVAGKNYKCTVCVSDKNTSETAKNAQSVAVIVNKERAKRGLKPLTLDYNLCMAAVERSKELTKKFDHVRPDGSSCFTIFKKYGFAVFSDRGENIASGYTTPKKVMDGWMNSPGHKARILDSAYEKIGVGYYFDEKEETCYWVQEFYTK